MESAGREAFLDSDIIHVSIHDAVLHAQKMFRKVSYSFLILILFHSILIHFSFLISRKKSYKYYNHVSLNTQKHSNLTFRLKKVIELHQKKYNSFSFYFNFISINFMLSCYNYTIYIYIK